MSDKIKEIYEINENAHSKIMKDMILFLDNCKTNKINCECSGVLKFNPNEINEFKKWSFLYQCDNNINKVKQMEDTTINLLNNIVDKKHEIYKINNVNKN